MLMKRKGLVAVIMFITLAAFITLSQAGEQKIELKGRIFRKAKAEVTIKDSATAGQKDISIDATGLKANSTYTVWLVSKKPKARIGLGTGDYSFKSDDKGAGTYGAMIPADDLNKWQMIEIAHHPSGDPKDMKKMKIVLNGMLKK